MRAMSERTWSDYLSGEIHSDWREQIEAGVREAFDAGYAAALGKPIITLHDADLDHALKEVDRAAQATARTAEQVVAVLGYVIRGQLP
jgi:hypothetical protein